MTISEVGDEGEMELTWFSKMLPPVLSLPQLRAVVQFSLQTLLAHKHTQIM